MKYGSKMSIFEQLDWWERQWRGSFNLDLYIKICKAKRNQIKDEDKRQCSGKRSQ